MKELIISSYLNLNSSYFNVNDVVTLDGFLKSQDEEKIKTLGSVVLLDPKAYFAISFFGGTIGLDRFILGDFGMGMVKLFFNIFTFFIPYIVDLFIIQKRVRKKNFEKLMRF